MTDYEEQGGFVEAMWAIREAFEKIDRMLNQDSKFAAWRRSKRDVEQKRGRRWNSSPTETVQDGRPQYHRRLERGRNGSYMDRRGQSQ